GALGVADGHLHVVQEARRVQDVIVVFDPFADLPRQVIHTEGMLVAGPESPRCQVLGVLLDEFSHGRSLPKSIWRCNEEARLPGWRQVDPGAREYLWIRRVPE